MINLKPGCLDDTSGLRPIGDLWTERRQPWGELLPGGLCYARQPEGLDALVARYQGGG